MRDRAPHLTALVHGSRALGEQLSTTCALQNISIPILITAMGGFYFVRDNEVHYDMAASKDKGVGARFLGFRPSNPRPPGHHGDRRGMMST